MAEVLSEDLKLLFHFKRKVQVAVLRITMRYWTGCLADFTLSFLNGSLKMKIFILAPFPSFTSTRLSTDHKIGPLKLGL